MGFLSYFYWLIFALLATSIVNLLALTLVIVLYCTVWDPVSTSDVWTTYTFENIILKFRVKCSSRKTIFLIICVILGNKTNAKILYGNFPEQHNCVYGTRYGLYKCSHRRHQTISLVSFELNVRSHSGTSYYT